MRHSLTYGQTRFNPLLLPTNWIVTKDILMTLMIWASITLGNFSCNMSRNFVATQVARYENWDVRPVAQSNIYCFFALSGSRIPKLCAQDWHINNTSWKKLRYNFRDDVLQQRSTTEHFVAALQEALHRVELTSTFRNDCGNKKIARNVCGRT